MGALVSTLEPKVQPPVGKPQGKVPSLHRIFYINLDRRPERRKRFMKSVQDNALENITSRFAAVNGRSYNLDKYPRSVVVEEAVQTAATPPRIVNGSYMTRGALGLSLSYHTLLNVIADDRDEDHVYLICEDDATMVPNFSNRIARSLEAAARHEPGWDFLHVGYYDDDCNVWPVERRADGETTGSWVAEVIWQPQKVYGLFGSALRPCGARKLLKHL